MTWKQARRILTEISLTRFPFASEYEFLQKVSLKVALTEIEGMTWLLSIQDEEKLMSIYKDAMENYK